MKDNEKNIEQELNEISPFLSGLKRKPEERFSMPQDYFTNFEDRLRGRIEEEEALSGERDKQKEQSPRFLLTFIRSLFSPKYAAVFGCVGLLLVLQLFWFTKGERALNPFDYNQMAGLDLNENFNKLTENEANNYVLANLTEFETEDLLESMTDTEIQELNGEIEDYEEQFIQSSVPTDTLEPNDKITNDTDPTKIKGDDKTKEDKPQNFKTELEEEALDEADIDDLFSELSDEDFDFLEAALLGTEKKGDRKKEPKLDK